MGSNPGFESYFIPLLLVKATVLTDPSGSLKEVHKIFMMDCMRSPLRATGLGVNEVGHGSSSSGRLSLRQGTALPYISIHLYVNTYVYLCMSPT